MGSLLSRLAGKGYGVLKPEIAETADAFLAPVRTRREELRKDPDLAARIGKGSDLLDAGAREIAAHLARAAG